MGGYLPLHVGAVSAYYSSSPQGGKKQIVLTNGIVSTYRNLYTEIYQQKLVNIEIYTIDSREKTHCPVSGDGAVE